MGEHRAGSFVAWLKKELAAHSRMAGFEIAPDSPMRRGLVPAVGDRSCTTTGAAVVSYGPVNANFPRLARERPSKSSPFFDDRWISRVNE
jgi:hypothetical protein